MRIETLVRALQQLPQDAEIRVAAAIQATAYDDKASFDLPLVGITNALSPMLLVPFEECELTKVYWLITSHTLSVKHDI